MANTDAPRGYKLVGQLHGSLPKARKYFIPATDETAVFVGDAVKYAGSSDAAGAYATVAQAAAGNAILGVVAGVEPVEGVSVGSVNLNRMHRPADTAMYVYVYDDPNTLFMIQDDADSATLAATDIGLNANVIVGSGNTTSGMSAMEVDTSSKATTATLQVKILGIADRPDNSIGANADLIVKINNHQHGSHTGSAGV